MAEAERERERERRGPKTEDKYRPEKLEKVAQIKKLSCFFPHIYHPQFYPLWTPLEHKNLEYLNIHIPTFFWILSEPVSLSYPSSLCRSELEIEEIFTEGEGRKTAVD